MRHPNKIDFSGHIFGAGSVQMDIINPSGSYLTTLPPFIYQRCSDGDTFACTNFSAMDTARILGLFLYQTLLDISPSYSAVVSGTKPGVGNTSQAATSELETNWACANVDRPYTPQVTTLAEFYTATTDEQNSAAVLALQNWQLNSGNLVEVPGQVYSSVDTIKQALLTSPVRACVDGYYQWDAQGRIASPTNYNYDHMIVIVGIRQSDGAYEVYDSENTAIEYFAPDYQMGYCNIYSLKKKSMFELIKETGLAPVYLHLIVSDSYYGIADSLQNDTVVISGGDLLKTFSGNYQDAIINTVPSFDHSKIKGNVSLNFN